MPNTLEIFDPEKIAQTLSDKKVGDLPDQDLLTGVIAPDQPIEAGDLTLTLKARANAQIQALNAASDVDEDGVFGEPDLSEDAFKIAPQLRFQQGQGWLKYLLATSAEAGVSLDGQASAIKFALGTSGKTGIRISSYRRHSLDENAAQAVRADVQPFRHILRAEDIANLAEGDALALNTSGSLDANLTLSWSDVFASSLNRLSHLLNTSEPLVLDVDLGASFKAGIAVQDAYTLIFTRPNAAQNRVKISVFKGSSDQRSVSFSASIGAKFNNPEVLETALNSLVQSWYDDLKVPEIEAFLNKTNMEALTAQEKEWVEKLIEKLELDGPLEKLAELRTRWQDVKEAVNEVASSLVQDLDEESSDLQARINAASTRVLNKLLQNSSVQDVDRLVKQLKLSDLSDEDRQRVLSLVDALGLSDEYENTQAFLGQWDALKEKATNAVTRLATDLTGNIEDIETRAADAIEKVRNALVGNDVVVKVDAFLEDANKENLVELATGELDDLLKKLGIHKAIDQLQKLNGRWTQLKGKISDGITKVANAEASATFSYEYQRLATDKSLLELYADVSWFAPGQEMHGNLVRGRLEPVLDDLRENKAGLKLISYLEEETLDVKRSYGFGLSFGTWALSGRDSVILRETTRRNLKKQEMINLAVARGYSARLGKNEFSWNISLKADMDRFSDHPDANDPKYGMYFEFEMTEDKLSAEDLARALDLALIWGSLRDGSPAGMGAVANRLQFLRDQRVTARTSIRLDDKAFRTALDFFSVLSPAFGFAMAEGMYFAPDVSPALAHPGTRALVYGPLWTKYVVDLARLKPGKRKREGKVSKWAPTIIQYLRERTPFPELSMIEKEHARSPYTMSGQLYLNPRFFQRWADFADGMSELREAIKANGPFDEVEEAFRDSEPFFAQGTWVRALGRYALASLAVISDGQLSGVECSTTFTYEEDNQQREITLGSSQPLPVQLPTDLA